MFWIDWKSFHSFFDVIYINWRPEMFRHKSTLHELVTPNLEPPIFHFQVFDSHFLILSFSILLFSNSPNSVWKPSNVEKDWYDISKFRVQPFDVLIPRLPLSHIVLE